MDLTTIHPDVINLLDAETALDLKVIPVGIALDNTVTVATPGVASGHLIESVRFALGTPYKVQVAHCTAEEFEAAFRFHYGRPKDIEASKASRRHSYFTLKGKTILLLVGVATVFTLFSIMLKTDSQNPWAGFKVGSYAKGRLTTVIDLAGRRMRSITQVKQTLVELTAANAVVEVETTVMGKTTKTRRKIRLSASSDSIVIPADDEGITISLTCGRAGGTVLNKGTETLTVGDKPISCNWIETNDVVKKTRQTFTSVKGTPGLLDASNKAQDLEKVTRKTWISEQIPGMLAKEIRKISGGGTEEFAIPDLAIEVTYEVVDFLAMKLP